MYIKNKMPHLQFPTTYVYWENVNDHDHLKRKYMPIIDKLEQTNRDKLKNKFDNCTVKYMSIKSGNKINSFLEREDINRIIWNPIDNFIKEINSTYNCKINVKDSIINNYWFNTYDVHDHQEFHCHNGIPIVRNCKMYHPTFSGVYILNDENKSSSIVFKTSITPFEHTIEPYTFDTRDNNDIKEGAVIIFPNCLEHMVKKCIKPGRRTIAFNIFSML
jgi:hypothetical protein